MTRPVSIACFLLVSTFSTWNSVTSAEDPLAEQHLRRAIAAAGGERRLDTLKAPMMWMEKGTFHGGEQPIPFIAQYASKWPDWHRQKIEGAFSIGVSGDSAFVSTASGERILEGAQLKERLTQTRLAWAKFLFPLQGDAYSLTSIDGIQVDGRDTIGIRASHPDGREASFYFDKERFLLAKIETVVVSPETGPDPVKSETFFDNHRSFGGAMLPGKYRSFYDGKLFVEAETVDVKVRATLDPRWFSTAGSGQPASTP